MEHAGFPSDETLAAFIDGRLDAETRRRVVEHIAECEECWSVVMASTEMSNAVTELQPTGRVAAMPRRWWWGAVAAAVLVGVVGGGVLQHFRRANDPSALIAALNQAVPPQRNIEGRLFGFDYQRPTPVKRNAGNPKDIFQSPTERLQLEIAVLKVQQATQTSSALDALHARAISDLVVGDFGGAIEIFERILKMSTGESNPQSAIARATNAELLSDLSAAYAARNAAENSDRDANLALECAERAWALKKTPEVAWNRAVALSLTPLTADARAAWREYLALDSSSPWAAEARNRLALLPPEPNAGNAKSLKDEITQAAIAADERRIQRFAGQAPQAVREAAEALLLSGSSNATAAFALAKELCSRYGECSLADSSGVIAAQRQKSQLIVEFDRVCGSFSRPIPDRAEKRQKLLEARAVFDSLNLPIRELLTLRIATNLFEERRFDDAIAELSTIAAARSPALRAQRFWLEGLCQVSKGYAGVALESYRQAAKLFAGNGESDNVAAINMLMGEAFRFVGRVDEAFRYDRAALSRLLPTGDPARCVIALNSAAWTASRAGLPRMSLLIQDRAVEYARLVADSAYLAQALVTRASARFAVGDVNGARDDLVGSRAAFLRIVDNASRSRLQPEIELTAAAINQHSEPRVALQKVENALQSAAATGDHFRLLRGRFLRAQILQELHRDAEAETGYRDAVGELEQVRTRIVGDRMRISYFETGERVQRALMEMLLAQARTAEALDVADARKARVLLDRTSASPAARLHPWNEIAAAIDTQTAVIEYAVLDKRIVAWVGTHAELHYYALSLDPAELRPLAERLQNGSLNDRTAAYDLLLRPLRCRAAKRLIIVADGDLARIAFPLLYDREEGRYAIEEFELMLEPSLNYFTERRPAGKSFHSMFALTAVNGARLAGVPAEVASITRLFPRVETGMTAGDLLLRATNFDIIHFAGHADPNAAAPALMLLPDSARPDGRLYSTEIEAVHFAKAPLVVLSACGTSRGSTASEGTMSLARSFLAAGAGTVVATVWDVDDAVSAALMRRFYENISRGETVGSALRLAQTALLHDPTQGTSTDWSAFQVIGGT